MELNQAREMVKSIFAEKLKEKEEEVDLISERIKEVQNALQLVRYGSVTAMSNQTQIYGPQSENYQPSIHPAASALIKGKRPSNNELSEIPIKIKIEEDPLTAVPAYVPPKPKTLKGNPTKEPRGSHLKVKRTIGQVSHQYLMFIKWPLGALGDQTFGFDRLKVLYNQSFVHFWCMLWPFLIYFALM